MLDGNIERSTPIEISSGTKHPISSGCKTNSISVPEKFPNEFHILGDSSTETEVLSVGDFILGEGDLAHSLELHHETRKRSPHAVDEVLVGRILDADD